MSTLSKETNIWRYENDEVINRLEQMPALKEATLSRDWKNHVTINVVEYKKVGYLEESETVRPLLSSGALMSSKDKNNYSGDSPVLIGFSDDEYLVKTARELAEVESHITSHISEIYYTPDDVNAFRLYLIMNDGFEVSTVINGLSHHLASYPSIVQQLDQTKKGIIEIDQTGAVFKPFSSTVKPFVRVQ